MKTYQNPNSLILTSSHRQHNKTRMRMQALFEGRMQNKVTPILIYGQNLGSEVKGYRKDLAPVFYQEGVSLVDDRVLKRVRKELKLPELPPEFFEFKDLRVQKTR